MSPEPKATPVHVARRGTRPVQVEDLWLTPRVGAPVATPDGRALLVPVTRWNLDRNEARTQFHRVPLDGGASRALTAPEVSAAEPRVSPDGTRLAFTRKDANGRAQLMLMPLDGGEARRLTDLPLGVFDPRWLPDGSAIVFASLLLKGHLTHEATAAELKRRADDPVKAQVTEDRVYRFWDQWLTTGEVPHLFVYDLARDTVRDLMPESTVWFDWMDPSGQYDLSPDGREIALAGQVFDETRSLLVSRVFTVPVTGGALRCLTPDHPADDLRPRYSPDGRHLLYGMTHDVEFYADRIRLMRMDRATGVHTEWLGDWDFIPTHWEYAADGTVVFEADHHGRLKLFAFDGQGAPRELTSTGSVTASTPLAGGRVAFLHQSLAAPAEVHVVPLAGGAATRLTSFTDASTAVHHVGEVREVVFPGAHDVPVQMFIVLPPDYQEGRRYPLVHMIHGGPHGSFGDMWHARWNAQAFAAPGYVVALVNFQGSTGWGQHFAQCIQGEWAARPFEDIQRATDRLIAMGLVDETRMAVTGGSYGGYMVSWIGAHTDRFKCIVNHAGVVDLTGQYASDITQGRGRASGGEAWDGLERQDLWSPIRFAKGMNTPMLVVHGEKDYRVPVGHGLLVYGMLKAKGVPARLVYFPDENHWVLKARNSLLWYGEVLGWLARWLA
ncbi:MAG: Prolyl tripeptidyl peptidase precursor [Candidatus Eisenbacteria bacterium]